MGNSHQAHDDEAGRSEMVLTYSLTYKDVVDILHLIDESATYQEFHLELGEFKLSIVRNSRDSSGAPALAEARLSAKEIAGTDAVAPAATSAVEEPPRFSVSSGIAVTSPLPGTFYRAPAPGAPPFVEVGTIVKKDDPLCIIEVMKLMNLLRAPDAGVIREICVENETIVEPGQVLMIIDPTGT